MVGRPCCHSNASSGSGVMRGQRRTCEWPSGLPSHSLPQDQVQALSKALPLPTHLTQSAGRLVGESCLRCELWIRCLWTSSSAEGSVQKWSAVFILVYSRAQGPTAENTGLGTWSPQKCSHPTALDRSLSFQAARMPQSTLEQETGP